MSLDEFLPPVFDALLRGSYSGTTLHIQTLTRTLDLYVRANAVNAIVEEKTPLADWFISKAQTSEQRTYRLLTAWYLGDTNQEGQGFRLKFKTARWLKLPYGINMDLLLEGATHLSSSARRSLFASFTPHHVVAMVPWNSTTNPKRRSPSFVNASSAATRKPLQSKRATGRHILPRVVHRPRVRINPRGLA